MNKFTKDMVNDYANKLLIGLSDEENKMVLEEFDIIDKNIDIITKIPNINEITPMTHALDDFEFIPRDDIAVESDDINDLLSNCQNKMDREIIVPKVVGGDE